MHFFAKKFGHVKKKQYLCTLKMHFFAKKFGHVKKKQYLCTRF